MTSVFLSGSRKISRLNDAIRQRLEKMMENRLSIMVGDANGADKAMQTYLSKRGYEDVTVYFVGDNPRNNIGGWHSIHVATEPGQSGREFYTQKDKEMANVAEFGFVLWDGKSAGSVNNIVELAMRGKKVVVYSGPEKAFHNILSGSDLEDLLKRNDAFNIQTVRNRLAMIDQGASPAAVGQIPFSFL